MPRPFRSVALQRRSRRFRLLNMIFFWSRHIGGWTYPDEGCSRSADDRDRPAILRDDPPRVGAKPRPTSHVVIRRRTNAPSPCDVWPRVANPGGYRDRSSSASSAANRARNTGSPVAISSRCLRVNIFAWRRIARDVRKWRMTKDRWRLRASKPWINFPSRSATGDTPDLAYVTLWRTENSRRISKMKFNSKVIMIRTRILTRALGSTATLKSF